MTVLPQRSSAPGASAPVATISPPATNGTTDGSGFLPVEVPVQVSNHGSRSLSDGGRSQGDHGGNAMSVGGSKRQRRLRSGERVFAGIAILAMVVVVLNPVVAQVGSASPMMQVSQPGAGHTTPPPSVPLPLPPPQLPQRQIPSGSITNSKKFPRPATLSGSVP